MDKRLIFSVLPALFAGVAWGQVSVDISGGGVRVQHDGGNEVSVNSGGVSPDVEMTGVAVINETVYIDGDKIPKGSKRYTSKKSGKTYLINWGKDGNVSVAEQ
jgi:hypothetical protein